MIDAPAQRKKYEVLARKNKMSAKDLYGYILNERGKKALVLDLQQKNKPKLFVERRKLYHYRVFVESEKDNPMLDVGFNIFADIDFTKNIKMSTGCLIRTEKEDGHFTPRR